VRAPGMTNAGLRIRFLDAKSISRVLEKGIRGAKIVSRVLEKGFPNVKSVLRVLKM
jgi:hypothetical protein